jgi:hypothetical protein
MISFLQWLTEVGQTGGVGGGLTPPRLDPLERGTQAFPQYDQGDKSSPESDDPPTGWSKKKRMKKKMKKK